MIGLLNAYRFDPKVAYHNEYSALFFDFFARVLKPQPVKMYDVALGKIPTVSACAGYILSGSPKAVYDADPWIAQVADFIRQANDHKTKLVGICFGHQLIAHSLGGRAEKAVAGWGVGVHSFKILKQLPWMQPPMSQASLLFSHQDQVIKLPPGAQLLAQDSFCPHQMYAIDEHIYSLQGHPEFTPEFARGRLDARIKKIGEKKTQAAIASLQNPHHGEEIGQWIRQFLQKS